mmetsp:Transcript_54605/g.80102  ORF Transcript_54605/g.80102 Transcript_54605/m.80102 type:complete len:113 (+) Transcript_54605:678-1016(+)
MRASPLHNSSPRTQPLELRKSGREGDRCHNLPAGLMGYTISSIGNHTTIFNTTIFNTLQYTPTKPILRCRHAKEEASSPLECPLTLPSQASVGRARRLFEDTDIRENTLGHY